MVVTWTVAGIGDSQLTLCTHVIVMDGHVRVGLKDCICVRKRELASNEQLVKRIGQVGKILNRKIVTSFICLP